MTVTHSSIVTIAAWVLVFVALAVTARWMYRRSCSDRKNRDQWGAGAALVGGAGVVLVPVFLWVLSPYDWAYHSWRPVSGVVATIDYRLIPAGDGFAEQVFVATLRGEPGTAYGIYDVRGAAVRQGDQLELQCVLERREAGTPANRCEFVRFHRFGES